MKYADINIQVEYSNKLINADAPHIYKIYYVKYRVYQLSCNIKNRCISASRKHNPILKKVLKSPWKTIFVHAKVIEQL